MNTQELLLSFARDVLELSHSDDIMNLIQDELDDSIAYYADLLDEQQEEA